MSVRLPGAPDKAETRPTVTIKVTKAKIIGASIAAVALLLLVGGIVEVTYLNALCLWFISSGWIFLLWLASFGLVVLVWFRTAKQGRYGDTEHGVKGWLAVVGTFLGVVAFGLVVMFGGGFVTTSIYNSHVSLEASDTTPAFAQRAALSVVEAQVANNIVTNGDKGQVTYIPQQDRYTMPVSSRDAYAGYIELVNQKVALTGVAQNGGCTFDRAANARFGGVLGSNLYRKVMQKAGFGTFFDANDSYGYCDADDNPVIVVPLKKLTGIWPMIEEPNGVALYSGKTGEVTIVRDAKANSIPGHTFPISLSEKLWASTSAQSGFWPWFWNQAGYENTSAADKEDPNAGNDSDFALNLADGSGVVFATPLTMRGGSTAISAIGVVDAGLVTDQGLPTYRIHRFSPEHVRLSNSAVVAQLKTNYPDLSWQSGLRIFEVAPAGADKWVASIGLEQSISYRALVEANPVNSCLLTATGVQISCTGTLATNNVDEAKGKSILETDLSVLTDEQLVILNQKVADQFTLRAKAKK